MWPPFLEFSWRRSHLPYHLCTGVTYHGYLSVWRWQQDVVNPGSLGWPTQWNHPYIPTACNWMDRPKYRFLAVLKNLDSQTYAVPMIPPGYQYIVLPHLVLLLKLYKNKEAIQSNPSEATLEPPALLACLASVAIHNINSIFLPLYNLASKTHPWYPIFLGKYLHSLVLQWRHKSSSVGHVRFYQLRLPEPSSCCFR